MHKLTTREIISDIFGFICLIAILYIGAMALYVFEPEINHIAGVR